MDSQDQNQPDQAQGTNDASQPFVIGAFTPYFEREKMDKWSWVAVAVMIGNYRKTGPLDTNKNTQRWTQELVMTRCIGTSTMNVSGSPDSSMRITMVYEPSNTANAPVKDSLSAMRKAITSLAPVVVGWGTPQGDQIGNPHYIVVYGYEGDNWYFADPAQQALTKNAPLPIPEGDNVVTKVVYSRVIRMR